MYKDKQKIREGNLLAIASSYIFLIIFYLKYKNNRTRELIRVSADNVA